MRCMRIVAFCQQTWLVKLCRFGFWKMKSQLCIPFSQDPHILMSILFIHTIKPLVVQSWDTVFCTVFAWVGPRLLTNIADLRTSAWFCNVDFCFAHQQNKTKFHMILTCVQLWFTFARHKWTNKFKCFTVKFPHCSFVHLLLYVPHIFRFCGVFIFTPRKVYATDQTKSQTCACCGCVTFNNHHRCSWMLQCVVCSIYQGLWLTLPLLLCEDWLLNHCKCPFSQLHFPIPFDIFFLGFEMRLFRLRQQTDGNNSRADRKSVFSTGVPW